MEGALDIVYWALIIPAIFAVWAIKDPPGWILALAAGLISVAVFVWTLDWLVW